MAEYTRRDAEYAANIVERLLGRQAEGLEVESDIAVSDIQSDASAFADDLSLLEEFGVNVPAVRIAEEKVPISLSLAIGRSDGWASPFGYRIDRPWRRNPFFHEYAYDLLREIQRHEGEIDGFTTLGREEARGTFIRRATDFLATRVASVRSVRNRPNDQISWHGLSVLRMRQLARGPQIATPGCTFTVAANSVGLRVFWSGAYYVTPNYFSHPTSPTSGVLQSGTYIFGIDGGAYGNNIQWDLNSVISLPGSPYVHLNY